MKLNIRQEFKEKIKTLNLRVHSKNSKIIKKKLFTLDIFKKAKNIGLYFTKEGEIDTKKIILSSIKKNKNIFLPKIKGAELNFKQIKNLNELEPGKFKILEPKKKLSLN